MKRIGIITLYYKNHNYGGLLQAYALQHYLSNMGYCVEQIRFQFYDFVDSSIKPQTLQSKSTNIFYNLSLKRILLKVLKLLTNKQYKKNLQLRYLALEKFESQIPHSQRVYNDSNIVDCIPIYDAFFVGSDQVWNVDWYDKKGLFLNFVPLGKPKFSYAASMPSTQISENKKEQIKKYLVGFDLISVREKNTAEYLTSVTDRSDIKLVLDPTLLLTKNDWEKLISHSRRINKRYVFCYFLGQSYIIRKIARLFAKKNKLKIITFPFLSGFDYEDVFFGDYKFFDATPNDFISLIRDAEYVLTDSFHACVFANIFKTKYVVFSRSNVGQNMDSRVTTLLDMFSSTERFCYGDRCSLEYINSVINKQLPKTSPKFEEQKLKSELFIKKCIEIVERNSKNEDRKN